MSQTITKCDCLVLVIGGFQLFSSGLVIGNSFAFISPITIFLASIFFYLSQSTPCGHNCIVATAWELARGKPLRTPVWRLTS